MLFSYTVRKNQLLCVDGQTTQVASVSIDATLSEWGSRWFKTKVHPYRGYSQHVGATQADSRYMYSVVQNKSAPIYTVSIANMLVQLKLTVDGAKQSKPIEVYSSS